MAPITVDVYYTQYLNRINPATGRFWQDQEVAAATSATQDQVAKWRQFAQDYSDACYKNGTLFTIAGLIAAYFQANPDEKPLASDEEWWSPLPGIKIRRKIGASTTLTDGEKVILQAISDLRTALGK